MSTFSTRRRRRAASLPYIVDGNDTVGDSETILGFVTERYRLTIDAALSPAQRTTNLLITRMLDDLYWVMSYSRWQDERYWPAFRAALLREHPSLTEEGLAKAQAFNASVTITRASAASIPMPPWRAGLPIWTRSPP